MCSLPASQFMRLTTHMRFGCRISSIAELEDDEEKTSIIMVDDRDERIVSPFRHGSCARSSQTLPTP